MHSLNTMHSYYRWIKYAVVSRLLMLLVQVGFTNVIERYDTSTFQQSILSHRHQSTVSRNILFPNGNIVDHYIQSIFHGYMKWDSVYFLSVSLYGYEYEQMLAFFPLFPTTISFLKKFVTVITFGSLSDLSIILIIAALVNVLAFSLSVVFLYKLTLLLSKSVEFAEVSVLLFCLNPANVFFTVFYTESLYSFLQFAGMYVLYQKDYGNLKYILAGAIFAAGSATRSNGLTSVGFLLYSYLIETVNLARNCQRKGMTLHNLFSIGVKTLALASSMIFAVLPFVLYQYYAYTVYCNSKFYTKKEDHWCYQTIPISYSYIQRHYWNVGPFMYFEIKQIPNFVLAFPVVYLSYAAIEYFFKSASKDVSQFFKDALQDQGVVQNRKYKGILPMMENPRVLPFVLHLLFLVTFGIITVHIQVLTRMLFSSSPAILWYCADQLCISKNKQKASWVKQYLILGYFVSYTLIGCLLHCNFYPWT